jgi:NTE family protein
LKLLAHRSVDEVVELIALGERATWPKIEMIRVQTKIGRTLDRIVGQVDHGAPKLSGSTVRQAS